ncbi:winged helix-turn-helix domain-containing protein [Candidatus Woesearchaeota archaeon]|nr:winged helix-turn-helix domain-containing protein [Candidatus Woesearchaeota archaeon]
MTEESFLLVSLNEEKSKKLAQVISNNTSRKILEILSKKSMTESELSKKLNLPMSTVHYNLKALEEAKLITADEFHYSEKGKEVNHYSLTNKYVIIAPQSDSKSENFLSKLKGLLPATAVSLLAGLGLYFSNKPPSLANGVFEKARLYDAGQAADAVPPVLKAMQPAEEMAQATFGSSSNVASNISGAIPNPNIPSLFQSFLHSEYGYMWFILGALFFLAAFLITIVVIDRKKKQNTSGK